MSIRLQFAGCLLALGLSAGLAQPSFAQRPRFAAQKPPKPANAPARQQHPAPRQQRQQQRQQGSQNGSANNANGAGHGRQNAPDWNRPAGGTVHSDRPPSANTPPKSYNNLTPQEK